MKPRILIFIIGILFMTLACSLLTPAAPDQTGVATIVAATIQALSANTAAPAAGPVNTPAPIVETAVPPADTAVPAPVQSGIPFSFQNVSMVIPFGLSESAKGEIVPEANETNSDPWSLAPEHVMITLNGYPLTREGFGPLIHVYPAEQYFNANPGGANSLTQLRNILSNPGTPLTQAKLPGIPFFNAAKLYSAQVSLLKFQSGEGVRMISESAQYPAPIVRELNYYHFEGLTSDGKYFIVGLFPVTAPLQATNDNPSADGIAFPADMGDEAGSQKYYQAVTDLLNSASPDSFQPSLNQIDALIQSIQITP